MILHTTEVAPLPSYRLFLCFTNGVAGEVDLSAELEGKVFETLRDPALFATTTQHPVMRTADCGLRTADGGLRTGPTVRAWHQNIYLS